MAGNGQNGYNGDSLGPISALSAPIGLTTDPNGLLIADSGNNLVRRLELATTDSTPEFTRATGCVGVLLTPSIPSCTVGLTFSPNVTSVRHAQLVVTENHMDPLGSLQTQTLTVPMNGIGSFTWGRLSSRNLVIPETTAGQVSKPGTVLFANSGSVPMTFSGVSIVDDANGYFQETDDCNTAQINAYASCSVSVTLNAPVAGTFTAHLQFQSDALNGTQVVTLTGTSAVQQPTSTAWTAPAAINYGTPLSATQLNATVTPASAPGLVTYSTTLGSVGLGSVIPAGTQTLIATFTPTDPLQYAVSTVQVTIQVNPVPLTITPNNVSIKVTDAIPAFTGNIAGIVNPNDHLTVNYTSPTAVAGVVGTYPIVATPAGDLAQPPWSNYIVNTKTGTLTIGTPLAHLVQSITSISSPLTAGGQMTVGDSVINTGSGAAGSTTTIFYLSTNGTNKWMQLGNRVIPQIGLNATSAASTLLSIPSNVPGTYYLLVCANAYKTVTESTNADDCKSTYPATISITSGVNLKISALSYVFGGGGVQITDTTSNVGPATSGASNTVFYLATVSGTTILNAKWMYLGNRNVAALTNTIPSTATTSWTLPAGLRGTFAVTACANAYKSATESDYTDNCTTTTATFTLP